MLDGERVQEDDTVAKLGLEEDNEIDAFVEMHGGGWASSR